MAKHDISKENLVLIKPKTPDSVLLTDQDVLMVITANSATTALLLLPGIISYTGELLDIMTISQHCEGYEVPIGWDLSHAVGNVPLDLHGRHVDFAIWGNDRYMNGGPNVRGGVFVHQRHNPAEWSTDVALPMEHRTGSLDAVGTSSDLASLKASLAIFALTRMDRLRIRSEKITLYLEQLLLQWPGNTPAPYKIMTPSKLADRGSQLSLVLDPHLLDPVLFSLQAQGICVDTATPSDGLVPDGRTEPTVIRVTPAALYNSYHDVFLFVTCFFEAICRAMAVREGHDKTPEPPGAFPQEPSARLA